MNLFQWLRRRHAPPIDVSRETPRPTGSAWAESTVAGPFAQHAPSDSLCTRCNPWHDHSHDARDRTEEGREWSGNDVRNPGGGGRRSH